MRKLFLIPFLFAVLGSAQTSTPPIPIAPNVAHRQIPPEKSPLKASAAHKNTYPCRLETDMHIIVYEKGGYTTMYETATAQPSDRAKLQTIPYCADSQERDGK